jgi:hypothetical protein
MRWRTTVTDTLVLSCGHNEDRWSSPDRAAQESLARPQHPPDVSASMG